MSEIFPEPQDKAPSLPFLEITSYVIIPGLFAAISQRCFMCAQLPLRACSQQNRLFTRALPGPDPTSHEVGSETSLGFPKLWIRPPCCKHFVLWHPCLASFLCEHQHCQKVRVKTFTFMFQKSRQNVPVNVSVSTDFSSLLY